MNELARRTFRLSRKAAQASIDATVTIAARTPGLMFSGLDPAGAGARETQKLVQEKIEAAYEGVLEAQAKLGSLWLRAAFGALSLSEASHAFVDVADAAAGPALRRVRANARRLTGLEPIG